MCVLLHKGLVLLKHRLCRRRETCYVAMGGFELEIQFHVIDLAGPYMKGQQGQ